MIKIFKYNTSKVLKKNENNEFHLVGYVGWIYYSLVKSDSYLIKMDIIQMVTSIVMKLQFENMFLFDMYLCII